MRKPVLFLFLLVCFSTVGQEVVLELPPNPKPEESISHSFAFTYQLDGDEVKTRLGHYDGIIYPENFEAEDTAFITEYFVGYPGKAERGIPVLVANYKSGLPTFYIDGNNNLDFSDDGEPVKMSPKDTTALLTFRNKGNPEASFSIKYWPAEQTDHTKLEKMLGTANLRKSGIHILPAEHWFYTKRYNNRVAKTVLNGDSVKVALHDYNCNGFFNDEDKDRIFVAPVEIPFQWEEKAGSFTLKNDSNLFLLHDQVYEVVSVDAVGSSITVKPSDWAYDPPLAAGQKMPALEFQLANGGNSSLADFVDGQRYLLIDLWGSWCKGCHASAAALTELSEKHPDELQILGLNSGEPLEKITAFTDKYSHNWPQGMVSSEIRNTFLVDGYPTYILVDPQGTIVSLQIYPQQIEEILAKGD